MKKKVLISTLGAALLFGGAFSVGATNNDEGRTANKVNNNEAFLSTDDIKKIALQEVAGTVEEIELERKSDRIVYEVDIENNDINYDLYIDAYTGEIYSVGSDDDDDNVNSSDGGQKNKNIISQSDATAIAEKAVNGKVIEIEKDEDDGLVKYEIELQADRGEAEIEIDAKDGKILDVEWDN
ncbi:PepSY domain-containing protein (plasmid) [Niallia sp. XMNu-256]|uniref:PepSY domain-containing protein n=1 Tax=Niallia sp. XMNu-256 TaxID=3082444 RepID=UPI0030CF163F